MRRWHAAGLDRWTGVTIAYVRVAWFAVLALRVHIDDVPMSQHESYLDQWRSLAASTRRPDPGDVLWRGDLQIGDVSVGVCLWRRAWWSW